MAKVSAALREVLRSAARLQEVVPDAILVAVSAAALHAGHRDSFDHDHVLADHLGEDTAVEVLSDIDTYYVDRSGEAGSVLTSLALALADPRPRDPDVVAELPRYKGLDERWHRWEDVVSACRALALRLAGAT